MNLCYRKKETDQEIICCIPCNPFYNSLKIGLVSSFQATQLAPYPQNLDKRDGTYGCRHYFVIAYVRQVLPRCCYFVNVTALPSLLNLPSSKALFMSDPIFLLSYFHFDFCCLFLQIVIVAKQPLRIISETQNRVLFKSW